MASVRRQAHKAVTIATITWRPALARECEVPQKSFKDVKSPFLWRKKTYDEDHHFC